jgi:hypothetical protein
MKEVAGPAIAILIDHDHARSPFARLRVRLRIQPLPLAAAAFFFPSIPADDLFQRASCSRRPTTCLRHRVTPPRFTWSTTATAAAAVVEEDDLTGAPAAAFLSQVALPLSSNLMEMNESSNSSTAQYQPGLLYY